jgi:endonuclease/exonuclease/phosphatase family metal-dependent hydrolase
VKRTGRVVALAAACTMLAAPMVSAQASTPQVDAGARVSAKAPKNALNVMTANLYLGASLSPVIKAIETNGDFYGSLRELYDTVQKTDFPLRAKAIAKRIKAENPDILTLNEVSNWTVVDSVPSAGLKNYDFLKIMKKELKAQGLDYKVGSQVLNAQLPPLPNVGLPYFDPAKGCPSPANPLAATCSISFQDRDVVMYNAKNKQLKALKHKASGNFKKQVTYTLAGLPISFNRGWTYRDFSYKGKPFTMMTSHLEVETGTAGTTGESNWPSPVQVAQGKELVKVAKKAAKDTGGRVILAGDFNSDANRQYSPTYSQMTKWFSDTWKQDGKPFGKAVGATCCQTGDLNSDVELDSGDPMVPTRIDLVLTRKATGVWTKVITNKLQDTQPKWESDHYFYAAAVKLK